jgi:hypothetical protein
LENKPRGADDQSVGAPYMSGLYHRALEIYRQTVGLRLVGRGEEGLDIEDVSPEDRRKILRQINEVIDRNRIKVDSDTFTITAKRSGIGLPILINGCIAAVVIGAILTFSLLFNRQEDVLAAGTGAIVSTESKLIETLRRESQAQLQEKDREIRTFQEQLQQTLAEQQRLREETDRTLQEREEQLEERLQRAVAEERQRLLDQGLSEAAVADRLRTFEAQKRAELESEYADFRRKTEEEAAAREANLAGLVRDYEQSLQAAQSERSDLERRFEQREAELQQQFEAQTQALESDRARVAEQLSRLQEQQRQEQLVRDQILGAYEGVNESIASGEYALALEQLESIRAYLDQEPARSLAGIQRRRAVEMFIISSLQDLIRSRAAEETRDPQSLIEAGGRIDALNLEVTTANQLLERGDTEAARQQYLAALDEIPAARTAYDRLSIVEARRRAQEQARADQRVASRISQGRSLFEEEQYEQSLERYREALTLLLEDPAAAGRIVDQIGEISARLAQAGTAAAAAAAPTQVEPEVRPETLQQPDEALLAQLQQSRDRIAQLEQENERLSGQLERLESQQQLLQGDQAEVAAQLAQLQEEKAAVTTAAEQLRAEKQSLADRIAELQSQNRALTGERDRLLSERIALEQERDQLVEAQKRAQEAEAARENLRERLADLESRYQNQRRSADLSGVTPPDTLADLLEAKLLTWQIIGSDPVASRYPELYDTMDRYLETLTEQSQLEGRYTDQEDLLARLLDKLELVIE